MKKIVLGLVLALLLSGCFQDSRDIAMKEYNRNHQKIKLGDSIDFALQYLQILQRALYADERRPADQFSKNGSTYYIHYQTTGWIEDGRYTDDEFTPYVFKDGKLVSIGWSALGGPKSFGDGASAAAANANARSRAAQNLSNILQKQIDQTNPQSQSNRPSNTQVCTVHKVGPNQYVEKCRDRGW